jgi:hypothetical protein
MSDDVPSLAEQEAEGQFREEVQKIVDGVVCDITAGHLVDKVSAFRRGDATVRLCAHATEFDLALNVLKYGCPKHLKLRVLELARLTVQGHVRLEMKTREEYKNLPTEKIDNGKEQSDQADDQEDDREDQAR